MIEPLAVPTGPAVLGLLPRIESALHGDAPFAPYAAGSPVPPLPEPGAPLPDDLAVVVGTSGSTGDPKLAMLSAAALRASATGTHEALGGPGSWLLAMPAQHVAGLQVLVRSVLSGTEPAVLDGSAGFTRDAFRSAATRHRSATGRRYTALVPTQVTRLLDDPAATEELAAYDAVLVGGAATPTAVRERAHTAGVHLVPTYGMSETAGGCVYAGRPLPGTRVRVEDGRVLLGGPTLAAGYLGRPDLTRRAFQVDPDGRRWFRTDDAGHLGADDLLHIDGRLDDLVVTGGYKVAPRVVEEAILARIGEVREVVVLGVPDAEWGQLVAAAVVVDGDGDGVDLRELRNRLRGALPDHALPRLLWVVDVIPALGPGKPDRAAVAAQIVVEQ